MPIQKKLPDAEFEIMKAIWSMPEPVTSPMVIEKLKYTLKSKKWKQQTVITILVRLERKGFLRSEKDAKERKYYSTVSEHDYMQYEISCFLSKFESGSFTSLASAFYNHKPMSDTDITELQKWLDERRK